jgi:hypothetical protein
MWSFFILDYDHSGKGYIIINQGKKTGRGGWTYTTRKDQKAGAEKKC